LSSLNSVFRAEGDKKMKLISYLMAGDPGFEPSLRRLKGLAETGVDILELGVPFSDPMADGPVIQAAAQRALANGMTVAKTLELVESFRQTHETPLVIMSYLNPLLQYGWARFVQVAVTVGVDGLIIPDLPWGEGKELRQSASNLVGDKLAFIPMIAQTSQAEDIQLLAHESTGFAYVLSRNGITGGEVDIPEQTLDLMENLRQQLNLPLCVGFGIQKAEQVRQLARVTDGVIIGSALVQKFTQLDQCYLQENEVRAGEEVIYSWLKSLRPPA